MHEKCRVHIQVKYTYDDAGQLIGQTQRMMPEWYWVPVVYEMVVPRTPDIYE